MKWKDYSKSDRIEKFVEGDWNVLDDLTGRKVRQSQTTKEWDGFRSTHSLPRHPQDFIRSHPERIRTPWSRPESEDTFVNSIQLPSSLDGLVSWYRFNIGITVTESGVSKWADQSGNGHHLLQSTDSARPSHEMDGSIFFDGDTERLRADPFTYDQPLTIFILAEPITWTHNDYIYDGATDKTCALLQFDATPMIRMKSGNEIGGPKFSEFTLGKYSIITTIFNGSASLLQANNNIPSAGDPGSADPGGFILGGNGDDEGDQTPHMRVKECFMYDSALSTVDITKMVNYLNNLGGGVF